MKAFYWILSSLMLLPGAFAQDELYCALKVKVTNSLGARSELAVVVQEADGKIIARSKSVGGEAAFCDVGSGPVTIVVQNFDCGEVVLRGVPVDWYPYTHEVHVVANECGMHWRVSIPCTLVVRVTDSEGKPVVGATPVDAGLRARNRPSDRYGRLWLTFDPNASGSVAVELDGRRSDSKSFSCDGSGVQAEVAITLP
jgi:hypothetical protein